MYGLSTDNYNWLLWSLRAQQDQRFFLRFSAAVCNFQYLGKKFPCLSSSVTLWRSLLSRESVMMGPQPKFPTVTIWSGQSLYYYPHPTSRPLSQECLFCPAPALERAMNARMHLHNMDQGSKCLGFARSCLPNLAKSSFILCSQERKPMRDSPVINCSLDRLCAVTFSASPWKLICTLVNLPAARQTLS